jgi:hypothetical protein
VWCWGGFEEGRRLSCERARGGGRRRARGNARERASAATALGARRARGAIGTVPKSAHRVRVGAGLLPRDVARHAGPAFLPRVGGDWRRGFQEHNRTLPFSQLPRLVPTEAKRARRPRRRVQEHSARIESARGSGRWGAPSIGRGARLRAFQRKRALRWFLMVARARCDKTYLVRLWRCLHERCVCACVRDITMCVWISGVWRERGARA